LKKNISIVKLSIIYGLILSVIWLIRLILRYFEYIGSNTVLIIEIILFLSVFYPIYKFKHINNGELNLKQALKIGLIIGLITGILSGLLYIISREFFPTNEYLEQLQNKRLKTAIDNPNMSPEEIRKMVKTPYIFNSNFIMGLFHLFFYVVIHLLISLIAGAILSKKKKINL